MPPLRRKRKSKTVAPMTLAYVTRKEDGAAVVYATCHFSGAVVGPVLGHSPRAVSVVIRELAAKCDCGRRIHRTRETLGAPAQLR